MSDESVKHSREPWKVYDAKYPGIDASNGEAVVFFSDERDDDSGGIRGGFDENTDPKANARRIVAAVNAVAGIPTEALESGALGKALDLLMKAQSFASGISIASSVDTTEWDFHRLAGGHLREELYAALRALGRI